jgi:hypothetical protein
MLASREGLVSAIGIIAQLQLKTNLGLLDIGKLRLIETRSVEDMDAVLSEMAESPPFSRIYSMTAAPGTHVSIVTPWKSVSMSSRISPSGAYVLVGAFGGIGEMIAEMLVRNGAKTLIFLSRRGAESPQAKERCEALKKSGIEVVAYAVDVADRQALDAAWASITRHFKVLGVVQCAAVLKVRFP